MMRRIRILGLSLIIATMLIACNNSHAIDSNNYNLSTDVIYQKDGYMSQYSYQIFREIVYKSDAIKFMDMPLLGVEEESVVMLNADRTFEKTVFISQEEMNEQIVKELEESVPKEALDRLKEHSVKYERLEYVDGTYVLAYYEIEESGHYQCVLFNYSSEKETAYVEFIVIRQIMNNSHKAELFAMYGEELCVCDEKWFNKNLEPIERPIIESKERSVSKDILVDALLNAESEEVTELGNDIGNTIFYQGRMEDVFYCVFSRESQSIPNDAYIAEVNVEGELLALVSLEGMSFFDLRTVVPKVFDEETSKYYDVIR